ncbi:MAG: substrate-binding domain-containing protein [Acidobacteriia bacterium]|nr:substrate-binding domain-containing protein [Terriglobia bacterium]
MNRNIKSTLSIASAVLALAAGFLIPAARRTPAQTAELRVMTSDGMKPSVEEMTPQIEHATGRKLVAQFDSSKNLRDKIQAGEPFDAAIITSDVLDSLIQQGKISAPSRREISRTGIGVGVRAGAAKPDIGTVEAFKRTLLNAKSISFNPSGASAVHIYDMFARMGITDTMKPKLILDTEAGRPQQNVAEGKADLVVTLIPEIKFFPGVELVGPVPAELQSYVNFAAGVATNARDAEGAKALIRFLAGPAAPPVLKAKGMEPR